MIRRSFAIAVVIASLAVATADATAQPDDEESALLVEEAREAIGKGEYADAGALLDRAINVNPRRIDAYVLRATVYGLLDQHDEAVATIRRAAKLAPRNPDVLTTLGSQLVFAGRAAEGVPILERVVADWPRRYQAHVVLGHHYATEHSWEPAITSLEAYFANRPESLAKEDNTHRADLANAYLRSDQPDRARALYARMLETDADSVLGRLGLAWSLAAIDCRKALPVLRKMDDLAETYAEVLAVRGRCALAADNRGEALTVSERYLASRPDDATAWALLGEAHAANGDYVAARRRLEGAVARDESNALFALRLARVERADNLPGAAATRLRAAGPPAGYEDEWTFELIEALYDDDAFADVLSELTPWIASHPDSGWGNGLLGIALLELGDADQAIEHLERALQLDPDQERARRPLVDALNTAATAEIAADRRDAARTLLERAASVSDDVLTARNLAIVRMLDGDANGAISVLEPFASGSDDVVLHVLGRAYAAVGRTAEATAALRKALELKPATTRAVDISIDLAAAELAAGNAPEAVTVLETVAAKATGGDQANRVAVAYVSAARAAATDAMSRGAYSRAYRLLSNARASLPAATDAAQRTALECDLALAATGAGAEGKALALLRELSDAKATCEFVAPADALAIDILIAWNEGKNARLAKASLGRLGVLRRKAKGAAQDLAETAARDIAMAAARTSYAKGSKGLKLARYYLAQAKKFGDNSDALAHNLAVLDLDAGKTDAALAALEKVANRVPEARVNLGIALEKKGKPIEALEQWRKAVRAGATHRSLDRWIQIKEKYWGAP